MSNTEQHLKRIQDKLQQLLKQHLALQKENQSLKEELKTNKQQLTDWGEKMDYLKQQVEILKLGSGEMDGNDKKQLEKRINGYLKEIDRCIVMLSS